MNDFTKEELEYINDCIFKGASCIRFDKHETLKEKLQSMIDNYCEHEAAGETEIFVDICKTCYSLLLRQKHY